MLISKTEYLPNISDKTTGESVKFLSSTKCNYIDNEIFQSALDDAEILKDNIDEKDEETPFYKKLSEDLFNSLFKAKPEVYDESNVYDSLKLENQVLKELIQNDTFEKLRRNTAGDIFNSTLSLGSFQDKAYEIIKTWTTESKENQQAMNDINNAIEAQEDLRNAIEELSYNPDNKSLQKAVNDLKQKVEQANNTINQNNANGQLQKSLNGMSNQLGNALQEATKEVQKASESLENFGMSDKGGDGESGNQRIPFDQKIKLVEALKKSKKLKSVVENLGRIRSVLGHVGKKPTQFGQVICDIGTGNNIKKTLSTDKVKLLDKDTELDFYKKFLDKGLLEYKSRGVQETKGPIIVCLDMSGSMSGRREYWSKGVAIAALQLAMEQKRDFKCICFASYVTRVYDFENKKKKDLDKMIELAEYFSSGGTNFERPLTEALNAVEESRFKKSDILFITDGEPSSFLTEKFRTHFNATKEAKELNVQSILIGCTNTKYLKEFSDEIITLNDLNKNNDLVNIFNRMGDR